MIRNIAKSIRYSIKVVVKLYIYILLILTLHTFGVNLVSVLFMVIYSAHSINIVVACMV